jgi:hypothetical protein
MTKLSGAIMCQQQFEAEVMDELKQQEQGK